MTKEFIPYEQALALKELGFDEPCFKYWVQTYNDTHVWMDVHDKALNDDDCKAPLYQQAFRWFRDKHGLYSWITMELGNKSTFCWVLSGEHTSTQYAAYFHTYEEAELDCLKKLIEIVKEKKD